MRPCGNDRRWLTWVVAAGLLVAGCDRAEGGGTAPSTPGPPSSPGPHELPTAASVSTDVMSEDRSAAVEARVDQLLAAMTLPEKVGQMTLVDRSVVEPADVARLGIGAVLTGGDSTPPRNDAEGWRTMVEGFQRAALTTRLGIPILYGVDAVHGHALVTGATVFPHNIGLGAANDAGLVEAIARATKREMVATGIRWNYAPVVAVPHDIRWGRTFEGYSEDTSLVTALSTAYLRGLQQEAGAAALTSPDDVIATPKHWIGDGGTTWGTSTNPDFSIDQGDTRLDEATLRARHLPPYQAAMTAGARSIMVSFSSWNGLKMHGNAFLVTDVLKGELGFDGFVVSDWAGIDQLPGDYASDIVAAVNAGIDMVMVPFEYEAFIAGLTAAVERGEVPLARVDDAVRRILRVKAEAGLFEQPLTEPGSSADVGSAEHRSLARQAVQQSLVLLKNDRATLPLAPAGSRFLVAGQGADDIGLQSGGWTITGQGLPGAITPGTTILDGIRASVDDPANVVYAPDGAFGDLPTTAAPVDVAVVVLAEAPYSEGAGDRADLALPPDDLELLARVRPLADRLVVVLLSGRPLVVTDQLPAWDAFVAAWLPGSEGAGIADVLFGRAPFSGRLPYTWPRTNAQVPFDPDAPLGTGCDGPLFPRGYAWAAGDVDLPACR